MLNPSIGKEWLKLSNLKEEFQHSGSDYSSLPNPQVNLYHAQVPTLSSGGAS